MDSKSLKTVFIKITDDEIISKCRVLASSNENIKVWEKGGHPFVFKTCDFINGNPVKLVLSYEKDELKFKDGQELLVNFVIRNVHYFSKTVLSKISTNNSDQLVEISFDYGMYKCEKRSFERLLAFPHRRLYACFNIGARACNDDGNLMFFKRPSKDNLLLFKRYMKEVSGENENKNLTGFRILDISCNGVSFLVNRTERSFFQEDRAKYEVVIDIGEKKYNIDDANIVYNIDYIGHYSISPSVPMYKIGMYFKSLNNDLGKKISEFIGSEMDVEIAKKDVEDFFK